MALPQPQSNGPRYSFPSPGPGPSNKAAWDDAVAQARSAMAGFNPGVLRQAVREMWEQTLVGSDYHSGFLCSTILHRTPAAVMCRSVEGHGARLVRTAGTQLAQHMTPKELDMVAPILLPKLSPGFLDKALALRLESIPAQQLVNALGRAERLGYDVRDVVTGDPSAAGRQERVIPTANPIPPPPGEAMSTWQAPPYQGDALQQNLPSNADLMRLGIVFCDRCNRPCGSLKALYSHKKSGSCGKPPAPITRLGKEYCVFCGSVFTQQAGLRYHTVNAVCGHHKPEVHVSLMTLFQDADKQRLRDSTGAQPGHGPPSRQGPSAPTEPRPHHNPKAGRDPYAGLTPETRARFEAEMSRAEEHFGAQMKRALELPAEQQQAEIARLKNGLNNKQSLTRKKYGIRLRERRSRAELASERDRLMGSGRETPGSAGGHTLTELTGTPDSTGKRAYSDFTGTPGSAGQGSPSEYSRQSSPKRIVSDVDVSGPAPAGHQGANLSARSTASPVVASQAMPEAGPPSSRPMSMSAGSYTPAQPLHPPSDGPNGDIHGMGAEHHESDSDTEMDGHEGEHGEANG